MLSFLITQKTNNYWANTKPIIPLTGWFVSNQWRIGKRERCPGKAVLGRYVKAGSACLPYKYRTLPQSSANSCTFSYQGKNS